ncbi:MAG: hypothetical protein JWR85_4201 [Marmoricola sp.]|nr:hypothetical protein [Marmoricola sp.]
MNGALNAAAANAAFRAIGAAMLDPNVSHIAYPSAEAIARRVVIGCRHSNTFREMQNFATGEYQCPKPVPDADMALLRDALQRHEARERARRRWAYKFGEVYDTGSYR